MSATPSGAGARLRGGGRPPSGPLQVVGTINAYAALLAQRAGFRAIYLSGAGVANASFGLPDLGMTSSTTCARTSAHHRGLRAAAAG